MASGASRRAAENRKSKATVAEDPRPELVDATRYDFERLEVVVKQLVDRHHTLLGENAELHRRLVASDARAIASKEEVEDLRKRRDRTHERLDGLIADLDRLESALDDSSKPRASATKSRAGKSKPKKPRSSRKS